MENPTTTEPTGGLPLVKGEMLGKSGLNVLGNKGVALGMDDSASIRDYLQQMIEQRQAYKGSFQQGMDQMRSVLGSTQNEMAQNMQAQSNKERTNEQDIFNMRVNMAQLKTQEDRLLQEKMLAAKQQFMIQNTLRVAQGLPPLPEPSAGGMAQTPQVGMAQAPQVGMAPATQGGAAPAPAPQGAAPQGGAEAPPLNALQAATIAQLAVANPQEALKQMLSLTKPTDLQRELSFLPANVRNQIITAAKAGNMYQPFKYYDVNVGREVETSAADIIGKMFNVPSQLGGAPAGPAPVTGVKPPADGAAPAVAPVAPSAAPVAPAPVAAAPAPNVPVSAAVTSLRNLPNPNPRNSPSYAEFEADRNKKILEQQAKEAGVAVAGETREAEKVAETASEEQKQHSVDVREAQNNAMLAQNMQKDIRKADALLGKLAGGGAQSAFFGLIDGGIQIGQFGSVNLPKFTEAVVKMDPKAKDPAVMDAYIRVAKDVENLKLAYSRKVFQGQGAVTENERKLIDTAVGDVNRMSPANLMRMAKATELEARNKVDQDRLWSQMKNAGLSWSQYKNSAELKDMQRKQFYRTAKAFGIDNAVYPGDPAR
jgi:hypothetical protein